MNTTLILTAEIGNTRLAFGMAVATNENASGFSGSPAILAAFAIRSGYVPIDSAKADQARQQRPLLYTVIPHQNDEPLEARKTHFGGLLLT